MSYATTPDISTFLQAVDNAAAQLSLGVGLVNDGSTRLAPRAPLVLDDATGNEVGLTLTYTVNKATSGDVTGLLIDATETAVPGAHLPLDARVAGIKQAGITNTGQLLAWGTWTDDSNYYGARMRSASNLTLLEAIRAGTGPANVGVRLVSAGEGDFQFQNGTGGYLAINVKNGQPTFNQTFAMTLQTANSIVLFSGSSDGVQIKRLSSNEPFLAFANTSGVGDVLLYRDNAAGVSALRNGTNAQTFRVYGTYTNSTNYLRASLAATSTAVTLAAQSAGTGAADIDVTLTPKGTGHARFGSHSVIGSETVTGFVTIKDAGGTERKLAVVS